MDGDPVDETPPKVRILGEDPTCLTFTFINEDHTLGNALRYILIKNKDVEMCGYSIPHPSDNKLNLRLQTFKRPAKEVLYEGIAQLKEMAGIIKGKFEEEERRNELVVEQRNMEQVNGEQVNGEQVNGEQVDEVQVNGEQTNEDQIMEAG